MAISPLPPTRKTVLGRLATSLPLLARLWFAPVVLTAACAPQPTRQDNYPVETVRLKEYLEDHGILEECCKIDVNHPPRLKLTNDILFQIIRNGWSRDLLVSLEQQLKQQALPNTEKKLFLVYKDGKQAFAGYFYHKNSSQTHTRLIFFDLSTDISNYSDKHRLLAAILQHEIAHSHHFYYFTKMAGSWEKAHDASNNFFARKAAMVLDINLNNRPVTAIMADIVSLNKLLADRSPITQLMDEVITYDKLPARTSLLLYNNRIDRSFLQKHLKGTSTPAELALDLLMAQKLGEPKIAAELKGCVPNLSRENKRIFLKAYNLLYLQYEVSRRFIRYSDFNIGPKHG